MAELALMVSNYSERPRLDRTGLSGLYDIETEGWVPMRPRPAPPGAEPLVAAQGEPIRDYRGLMPTVDDPANAFESSA